MPGGVSAADHKLVDRHDKIELPKVIPVATRVELYAGRRQACGATTLAPSPQGLEQGSPFSVNIVAMALYLRSTHAISYKRLSRMMPELFGLAISEGALDAAFRRAKPGIDFKVGASWYVCGVPPLPFHWLRRWNLRQLRPHGLLGRGQRPG